MQKETQNCKKINPVFIYAHFQHVSNILIVRISRTRSWSGTLLLVQDVGSGLTQRWFILAVVVEVQPLYSYFFSYNLVPCHSFSVWFTSSANFSRLNHVRHADCVFRRVRTLTVPHLVSVFLLFSSLPFVRVVPIIFYLWLQSSEDFSACAAFA